MKSWIWGVIIIGIITLLIALSSAGKDSKSKSQEGIDINSEQLVVKADKIIIVNFFGTQRCVSCLTVGDLTKKTLNEKFAEELKNETVVFKEINGELPENEEEVVKYQARGSSLFINAVVDGKDNIAEDTDVWRLIYNEDQYINYLENKINRHLGE